MKHFQTLEATSGSEYPVFYCNTYDVHFRGHLCPVQLIQNSNLPKCILFASNCCCLVPQILQKLHLSWMFFSKSAVIYFFLSLFFICLSAHFPFITLVTIKVILCTTVTLRRGISEHGSALGAIATFYKTRMEGSLPTVIFLNRIMHSFSLLQAPLGGERSADRVLGTLAAASPTA